MSDNSLLITHRLNINMNGDIRGKVTLNTRTGDNYTHKLLIDLCTEEKKLKLGSLTTVTLYGKREDGSIFLSPCTVLSDGSVSHTFISSELSVPGNITCELHISTLSAEMTSPKFTVFVDGIIRNDNAIEASDDFSALAEALTQVENLNISVSGNTVTVVDKNGDSQSITVSDGSDGVSVTNSAIDSNGHLKITLSNGTVTDVGNVVGNNGVDVSSAYITNGNLYIRLSDNSVKSVGRVVGADGADGEDGEDGVTPHIGDNGNWYLGNVDTGVKARGPAGESVDFLSETEPTSATVGQVGDIILAKSTGLVFKCTDVSNGTYTWERVIGPVGIVVPYAPNSSGFRTIINNDIRDAMTKLHELSLSAIYPSQIGNQSSVKEYGSLLASTVNVFAADYGITAGGTYRSTVMYPAYYYEASGRYTLNNGNKVTGTYRAVDFLAPKSNDTQYIQKYSVRCWQLTSQSRGCETLTEDYPIEFLGESLIQVDSAPTAQSENPLSSGAAYTAFAGKADVSEVTGTSDTTVTLVVGDTVNVTGTPTTLSATLPSPTSGKDYACGLIFKAGANFSFTDTAPTGFSVVWKNEPTWTEGKVYEIIYRCLWETDTDSKIIISAVYQEV